MGSSRNSKIDCGRCSGFELNVTCPTSQSSLNGRAETEITHPWCSLLLDNLHLSRTAVPVGVTDVARVRRVRPVCRAEGFTDHESRPTCVIANARTPHTMQFQGSCSVEIRLQPTACKVHRRGPGHLYSFLTLHVSLVPYFIRTLMIADAFVPLVQREMEIKQQDIQDHDGQGKSSTLKVAAMISPVCVLYGIA